MERFYLNKKYKKEFISKGIGRDDLLLMEDMVSDSVNLFGLNPKNLSYRIIFRELDWEVNVLSYYTVEDVDREDLMRLYQLMIERKSGGIGIVFDNSNMKSLFMEDWYNSQRNLKLFKYKICDIKFKRHSELFNVSKLGENRTNNVVMKKLYGFRKHKFNHNDEWKKIIDEYNLNYKNWKDSFFNFDNNKSDNDE